MKKLMQWAIALCSAAMLAACGGGGSGDGAARTVTQDPALAINATTGPTLVAAIANETFAYQDGVPAFGTTAATNVTFSAPAAAGAAPGFTISSGGNTASGTMAFGSCIFRITASTFPDGSRLAAGQIITINPCNINVNARGTAADGVAATRSAALVVGAAASAGASVTISVNPGGQLTLNGVSVGTVTLSPITGAF
jgi:hypothetical protein